ncbi:hypothetical protein EfmAA242_06600 [Enterococcus faecium]|nr:hypothetical protein EfmAA242_06600 [Enterococcus faecium]
MKQFSRMFDENKTDRNDALRIADFLRIQRFTTSPIKEEKYMALQRLTRTRYQLIKQLIRTKQHFLENLTYKCNTLARNIFYHRVLLIYRIMSSLMTEDFTLDELAELPLEAFCDLLQEKGKGRFKQPEKIAKAIQRAITMSYRLGALAQESINVVLSVLVNFVKPQIFSIWFLPNYFNY